LYNNQKRYCFAPHLQEEEDVKPGKAKAFGGILSQEQVLDLHQHRPLVMFSVGAQCNDLAYANDPATDVSSLR
jgi:hypothetical protein